MSFVCGLHQHYITAHSSDLYLWQWLHSEITLFANLYVNTLNAHFEEISVVTGVDELLQGLTSSLTISEFSVIVSGHFRGSQHTVVGLWGDK